MKSTKRNDKEISGDVIQLISQLDEQRLVELNNLEQVQKIKNEVLILEQKRLINKYGKDSPRIQKISSRLAYNKSMFVALDIEKQRASIETEPLPNNAWRIHGRVFDQKNNPVNGITIFLTDEKQNWIRELGNVCTSETGYYSITVDDKLIDSLKGTALYISVSDKNQQIIYRDKKSFIATKGLIDYRDIYMDGRDCVPPPSDERTGDIKKDINIGDIKKDVIAGDIKKDITLGDLNKEKSGDDIKKDNTDGDLNKDELSGDLKKRKGK
ncbi:MAG: carboxypeptidase regulatory-like domain-containing protein [Bacteroidetes bacterium]|nr:carboxypeptidase regulatory-like domain-containing protein [Bacteroidota bacterium]